MPSNKTMYIPVGSGHVYATEFTGTIPADSVIETEANRLGYVEGGGTIEYTPTGTTFKDDMGLVSRSKLTAEEATFKAELIAWTTTAASAGLSVSTIPTQSTVMCA